MQLGNSKYETTAFNSRLQPTKIGLGTSTSDTSLLQLDYVYGTSTTNNGNVTSQTIKVPGVTYDFVQTYTYDNLNRLATATEAQNGSTTWSQTFGYDRYGNRNITAGTGTTSLTFSSSSNKITTSGYTYDNVGNTTADPSGKSFAYDAENKMLSASNGGTLGQYAYDGDGKRIKKYNTSTSDNRIFLYDAAGKLVEETDLSHAVQTSYVYAGSRLLSTETAGPTTNYLTADMLGTPRINTDASGNVTARHDYMPFGEEIFTALTAQRTSGVGYPGSDGVRKQFTGYERDGESGFDFAEARMYQSLIGRFATSDPSDVSLDFTAPQTQNRYAYVLNNPFRYTDDNGKWPTDTHMAFIREAFPGLTNGEKEDIIRGSNLVDTYFGSGHWHDIPTTLLMSNAPKHAMRPQGMSVADAQAQADGWIEDRLNAAINADNFRLGLIEFGKAMHTLMDDTSPAHTGFQEYTYPNTGNSLVDLVLFVMEGVDHKEIESRAPTEQEKKKTLLTMRAHFLGASIESCGRG